MVIGIVLAALAGTITLLWAFPASQRDADGPADAGASVTEDAIGSPRASDAGYTLAPPADPDSIVITDAAFSGWSLLERSTGRVSGSSNAATEGSTTESMIKPWIVADYLRQLADADETPDDATLDELALVIIDSNDPLAEKYYQLSGADDQTARLVDICGLTDLRIEPTFWGMTFMTPLDAMRYGECLADGRAAGPQWTKWLLDTMRHVRGEPSEFDPGEVQGGRWGIIDGLPPELAGDVSFKNGWTAYYDGWHVNCLAIHQDWVLSVMTVMPAGLLAGSEACASVTRALLIDRRS